MKQNASTGAQCGAPRRRWKPGQGQHPRPRNQDSQHMLNQHRGSFPESKKTSIVTKKDASQLNSRGQIHCGKNGECWGGTEDQGSWKEKERRMSLPLSIDYRNSPQKNCLNLALSVSSPRKSRNQEPRKTGFSKGGFCRVQCRGQGNRKYPRDFLEEGKRPPPPRQESVSGLY